MFISIPLHKLSFETYKLRRLQDFRSFSKDQIGFYTNQKEEKNIERLEKYFFVFTLVFLGWKNHKRSSFELENCSWGEGRFNNKHVCLIRMKNLFLSDQL